MNWFACYLAISCCNKFLIFFVFIREPGQNVRCHKCDRPCNVFLKNYFTINKMHIFLIYHFLFPTLISIAFILCNARLNKHDESFKHDLIFAVSYLFTNNGASLCVQWNKSYGPYNLLLKINELLFSLWTRS